MDYSAYEGYPRNVVMIGCKNPKNEKINYCAVAWHSYISFKPPLYGFFLSPERASHKFLKEFKEFNISFLSYEDSILIQQVGKTSADDVDKISKFKLEKFLQPGKKITIPYVDKAYTVYECKLNRVVEKIGDHSLFVGEIVNAIHIKDIAKKNTLVDLKKFQSTLYLGKGRYGTHNQDKVIKHPFEF